MTTVERKKITLNTCHSHINEMVKELMDVLIIKRIAELNNQLMLTFNFSGRLR